MTASQDGHGKLPLNRGEVVDSKEKKAINKSSKT